MTMSQLRVIISGGGTGGHIFPAIAIAKALQRKHPNTEILFVGAKGRMEMEKVPAAGFKIVGLNIAGFQRGSMLKNIFLPFKLAASLLQAISVVRTFKPDVAIGVGGYASGPLLRVASWLGVPTALQEQNSFAGVTNKILARNAQVVCTAYEGMEKVFTGAKVVLTGNPVRNEIANGSVQRSDALAFFGLDGSKKTILVIGGSLGANTLNRSVEAAMQRIQSEPVQVLWQTGKLYYENCKQSVMGFSNIHPHMFIDRMDMAYAAADVIVSRAGALSISELQLIGKPVILVPSPNVAEDHQTHNAMALVSKNAAIMIKDDEARLNLMSAAIDLLSDDLRCKTLAENIAKMAMRNADESIVNEVLKVCKK